MAGQMQSEEDLITNAGIADGFAVETDANMNSPISMPTGAQAVPIHAFESDPMSGPGQTSSNDHLHARDRKRRLTSNSDASRLHRARSGGAIRLDANAHINSVGCSCCVSITM